MIIYDGKKVFSLSEQWQFTVGIGEDWTFGNLSPYVVQGERFLTSKNDSRKSYSHYD